MLTSTIVYFENCPLLTAKLASATEYLLDLLNFVPASATDCRLDWLNFVPTSATENSSYPD
jgi:hypothetical protein